MNHSWSNTVSQPHIQCNKHDIAHTNQLWNFILLFIFKNLIWLNFYLFGQAVTKFLTCEMVCLCMKDMSKNRFIC